MLNIIVCEPHGSILAETKAHTNIEIVPRSPLGTTEKPQQADDASLKRQALVHLCPDPSAVSWERFQVVIGTPT